MRKGPLGALITATAATLIAFPGPAGAKTYRANKLGDHAPGACTRSDCTLREAVIASNARLGADRILLEGGRVYNLATAGPGEDAAATGDLDITDRLVIRPVARRGRRVPRRATVDANDLDRAFHALATTSLQRLVLRDGTAGLPGEDGGAALVDAADLTVRGSIVRANVAGDEGGGLKLAGVPPDGSLRVVRSRVSGNRANDNGGGGLDFDDGRGVISRSTVSGNHSVNVAGGFSLSSATVTVSGSTISRNGAENTSGGIRVGTDSVFTITNSTIEGNRAADEGGGIRVSDGTASFNAVTIVRNLANSDGNLDGGDGGGIQEDSSDPITFRNSIIAANEVGSGSTDPNCSSNGLVSGGNNLLSSADPACNFFVASGDTVAANPLLTALRSNGGPTKTACPKRGSPAINAAGSDAPGRDQRGVKKFRRRDIGACEFVPRKKR